MTKVKYYLYIPLRYFVTVETSEILLMSVRSYLQKTYLPV